MMSGGDREEEAFKLAQGEILDRHAATWNTRRKYVLPGELVDFKPADPRARLETDQELAGRLSGIIIRVMAPGAVSAEVVLVKLRIGQVWASIDRREAAMILGFDGNDPDRVESIGHVSEIGFMIEWNAEAAFRRQYPIQLFDPPAEL